MDKATLITLKQNKPQLLEGERLMKLYADMYGHDLDTLKASERAYANEKDPFGVYDGRYDIPEGSTYDTMSTDARPVLEVYPGASDTALMRKPLYETLIKVLGK